MLPLGGVTHVRLIICEPQSLFTSCLQLPMHLSLHHRLTAHIPCTHRHRCMSLRLPCTSHALIIIVACPCNCHAHPTHSSSVRMVPAAKIWRKAGMLHWWQMCHPCAIIAWPLLIKVDWAIRYETTVYASVLCLTL